MTLERLDIDNCTDRLQETLHRQRYDFVLSRLPKQAELLEVGTGVGAFTRELVSRCQSYVGVEFDPRACEEARKRTHRKAEILRADARQLPFEHERFSFIICLEVLEHLGDWRRGVTEIHRCLKQNGTAIISVPFRKRGGRSATNEHHVYEPGKKELINLLHKLFEEVRVFYQSFQESPFMTFARTLHVRRFVGLAKSYADLSRGEPSLLERIEIRSQPNGLKIGLIAFVTSKKPAGDQPQ